MCKLLTPGVGKRRKKISIFVQQRYIWEVQGWDSNTYWSSATSSFLEWKQSDRSQSGFFLLGFQMVQDYLFSLNKIIQYELLREKQFYQEKHQGMNYVVVQQKWNFITTYWFCWSQSIILQLLQTFIETLDTWLSIRLKSKCLLLGVT